MTGLSIDLTGSGAGAAKRLIAEIIASAKARGIDQATLAARAGISAESLSRLKKHGGCRLATALELARVAGYTSLDLPAGSAGQVASSSAALKLGAGRRRPIRAAELVAALRTGRPEAGHMTQAVFSMAATPTGFVFSGVFGYVTRFTAGNASPFCPSQDGLAGGMRTLATPPLADGA